MVASEMVEHDESWNISKSHAGTESDPVLARFLPFTTILYRYNTLLVVR